MNNTKILLTGATGFIGQELLPKLLAAGHEVHTIERYVTGRYSLRSSGNAITHYANLADYPAVRNIVREVKPDIVIHLAAISAVSFSYEHPIEVSEANYLGSVNLAEACYHEVPDFRQFITASTSEVYGTYLKDPKQSLMEGSPYEPNSPYAVAKVAFEYYLQYMRKAYSFPMTIMRPFNSFGRKDNKHFFIESVITQMLANPSGKVFLGDPKAIRDWLYVDDHVEGYLKAIGNKKAIGETFNLCTGISYTTKETAERIAELTGFKGEIIWRNTQPRPLDAHILRGNCQKTEEKLRWSPKYSLCKGLKKTIEYWRSQEGIA